MHLKQVMCYVCSLVFSTNNLRETSMSKGRCRCPLRPQNECEKVVWKPDLHVEHTVPWVAYSWCIHFKKGIRLDIANYVDGEEEEESGGDQSLDDHDMICPMLKQERESTETMKTFSYRAMLSIRYAHVACIYIKMIPL
ncbi:hypothetical protein HanHA300_Chr11g0416071 [Helianthus annuus]|nr:hypothetical protein HanHA300_Chr11g0416071 [Helianthus annuus]